MKCYHCRAKAKRKLRDLPICEACYVIALEHCADIEWPEFGKSILSEFTRRSVLKETYLVKRAEDIQRRKQNRAKWRAKSLEWDRCINQLP